MLIQTENGDQYEVEDSATPDQIDEVLKTVSAAPQEPKQPEKSFGDKAAHIAGVAGRDVFEGIAGLADFAPNILNAAQTVENKITGNNQPMLRTPITEVTKKALDAIDMPKEEGLGERILGAGVRGLAGGAIAGPVGAMSGTTAGAGAQTAAEAGAGPVTQMAVGMAAGMVPSAALLTAGRVGSEVVNAGKNVVKPFTQAGREQIVGKALKEAATDPDTAIQELKNAQEYIPGSSPTTGTATNDIGLKATERGLRSNVPNAFSDIESRNNTARNQALEDISGTPQTVAQLKKDREGVAGSIRDNAFKKFSDDPRMMDTQYKTFKQDVHERISSLKDVDLNKRTGVNQLSDMLSEYGYSLKKAASTSGKSNVYTATKTDPVTGAPVVFSFRTGENPLPKNLNKDYVDMADKAGLKKLADIIAKSEPTKPAVNPNFARGIAQRKLEAPTGNLTDVQIAMKTAQKRIANAVNIGDPQYAYELRKDLAQDVAGKLAKQAGGSGFDAGKYQRLAGRQLKDLLDSLDTQMEKAAPGYKDYMKKYSEMSKPIEQQQVLQDLHKDITTNAAPDNATGYQFISQPKLTAFIKNEMPELEKTLTQDQQAVLYNLQADLERKASLYQQNLKSEGSNTAANLKSDKVVTDMLTAKLKSHPLGKWVAGMNEKDLEKLNIDAFRDPKLAADLMEKVKPVLNKMPIMPAIRARLIQQMVGSAIGASGAKETK